MTRCPANWVPPYTPDEYERIPRILCSLDASHAGDHYDNYRDCIWFRQPGMGYAVEFRTAEPFGWMGLFAEPEDLGVDRGGAGH